MSWRYKGGFIQEYFDPLAYPTASLYSWGLNTNGQLGLGDTIHRSSPTQVGQLDTWSTVAGGSNFAVATKSDGTMWSCGSNNVGQLGLNISYSYNRSSPVQVGVLTTWSFVSGRSDFAGALKKDNTLWVWGNGAQGQLGQVTSSASRSSPVQVGSQAEWANFSCGAGTMLAIKSNGTLWAWGQNNFGQVGDGTTVSKSSPTQIGSDTSWSVVAGGGGTWSAAIKSDGTLWAWGRSNQGQLGQNDLVSRSSPVQIGALTDWSSIACAQSTLFAIKTNGTLWAVGQGGNGELGDNTTVSKSSPVQIGSDTNWSSIRAGNIFAIATRSDTTLWSWGYNAYGQLGDGTRINRSSPVQIGTRTDWISIGAGSDASYAIAKQ